MYCFLVYLFILHINTYKHYIIIKYRYGDNTNKWVITIYEKS